LLWAKQKGTGWGNCNQSGFPEDILSDAVKIQQSCACNQTQQFRQPVERVNALSHRGF